MNLKNKIIRAIYSSAAISIGVTPGCSQDIQSTQDQWEVSEERDRVRADMSSDLLASLDADTMTLHEDMREDCFEADMSYERWPPEGMERIWEPAGPVVICGSSDDSPCQSGDNYQGDTANAYLQEAVGDISVSLYCSSYRPRLEEGTSMCGPLRSSSGDECCYVVELAHQYCIEGRPFTVDGLARLASVTEQEGWCEAFTLGASAEALPDELRERIVYAWAEAGTHEHASVASFAKFIMELMSLGAPRHLVDAATKAMADESRHATDCFSIASAYAGKTLGPDKMNVQGGLSHIEDEAAILRAAIFEACIGETLAASVAQWLAPRAVDEGVREVFTRIAEEEGDHAELGWRFVQWMLATRPHLIPVAKACFEDAFESPVSPWAAGLTAHDRALLAHGCVSEPLEDHLRRRAFHHIVLPCAEALFDSLESAPPRTHV